MFKAVCAVRTTTASAEFVIRRQWAGAKYLETNGRTHRVNGVTHSASPFINGASNNVPSSQDNEPVTKPHDQDTLTINDFGQDQHRDNDGK